MRRWEAVTKWDSVKLFKDTIRGYGYCDRIYDSDTGHAVDIVWGANEYQNSVHPEDGAYEKLKDMLDKQTPAIRKAIVAICGDYSPCSLHRLMSCKKLLEVIEAMNEPVPIDAIIKEVESFKNGEIKSWDICDRVFDLNYLLGYKKGEFHKFQYVLYGLADCTTYGAARAIAALYPEDIDLINAVETYCKYECER